MEREKLIRSFAHQRLTFPQVLTIALTTECNLQCTHCWVDAGPDHSSVQAPRQAVLQLIEQFADLGGKAIRLTGGEPLLHSGWLELVEKVGAGDMQVLLQTNGMLFGEQELQGLKALKLKQLQIQISFDGAQAETHDLVRGAGAFVQAIAGVKELVRYGFGKDLALFFTEMRHNLHELPELLALAEQLGVASVSSGSLVACGRAEEDLVQPPEPEQYLPLLQRYRDDENFRRLYQELGCIAALEWCEAKTARQGCDFARSPYLTSQGKLFPCLLCHADDYAVSEVFSKGLGCALQEALPLWSSLQLISQQRSKMISECLNCALHASCAGGCMGRAYGSFGEFLVVEDRCRQKQLVAEWKKNN